jgi:uncharacterized membrane protein
MERLLFGLTFASALGSGLIAGLFFGFSVAVMTALGRLPAAAGISAMQSINVVIVNPLFLAVFLGTAICSVMLGIAAVFGWSDRTFYLLAGGLLYVVGSFVVTMVFNVPLNDALEAAAPASAEGASLWTRYLSVWTTWNHVRTVASLAAAACFTLALIP